MWGLPRQRDRLKVCQVLEVLISLPPSLFFFSIHSCIHLRVWTACILVGTLNPTQAFPPAPAPWMSPRPWGDPSDKDSVSSAVPDGTLFSRFRDSLQSVSSYVDARPVVLGPAGENLLGSFH